MEYNQDKLSKQREIKFWFFKYDWVFWLIKHKWAIWLVGAILFSVNVIPAIVLEDHIKVFSLLIAYPIMLILWQIAETNTFKLKNPLIIFLLPLIFFGVLAIMTIITIFMIIF